MPLFSPSADCSVHFPNNSRVYCRCLAPLLFRCVLLFSPEGRPGMSDDSPLSAISGLSFDSTLLSPLLFFCRDLLLSQSYQFSACWPILLTFSPENSSIFFVKKKAFFVKTDFVDFWDFRFDDLFVCRMTRKQIEACLSSNIILCGWLGSKFQLSN